MELAEAINQIDRNELINQVVLSWSVTYFSLSDSYRKGEKCIRTLSQRM